MVAAEDPYKLRASKQHVSFWVITEQRKLVEVSEAVILRQRRRRCFKNIITEMGIGRVTMGDCQ